MNDFTFTEENRGRLRSEWEFAKAMLGIHDDSTKGTPGLVVENPYKMYMSTIPLEVDDTELIYRARRAQKAWVNEGPYGRAKALRRLARKMRKVKKPLTILEYAQTGKKVEQAAGEVHSVIKLVDYFAGWADKIQGSQIPSQFQGRLVWTEREPLGVIAAFSTWNFPLNIAAWKVIPAITAGNSVILKPHEYAPFSAVALANLVNEAAGIDGLVTVALGGREVGAAVADLPVDKFCYTGSVGGGKAISSIASRHLIPVDLELGGKAPAVILDRLPPETLRRVLFGAIYNTGQMCSGGTRIIVVEDHNYDYTVETLIDIARGITAGHPYSNTDLGPLQNEQRLNEVESMIVKALSQNAEMLYEGRLKHDLNMMEWPGPYILPTLLAHDASNDLWNTEAFGPVVSLTKAVDADEAVDLANDNHYTLGASVWGGEIEDCLKVASRIKTGNVFVNYPSAPGPQEPSVPFGGHGGHSGWGRDLGLASLESLTTPRTTWVEF